MSGRLPTPLFIRPPTSREGRVTASWTKLNISRKILLHRVSNMQCINSKKGILQGSRSEHCKTIKWNNLPWKATCSVQIADQSFPQGACHMQYKTAGNKFQKVRVTCNVKTIKAWFFKVWGICNLKSDGCVSAMASHIQSKCSRKRFCKVQEVYNIRIAEEWYHKVWETWNIKTAQAGSHDVWAKCNGKTAKVGFSRH